MTMTTRASALLTIFLLSTPAEAQDLQITGYYEHTLNVDYSKKTDEQIMDASKLRLDFASGIPGGLSFNGNMNYIVYHGEISRNISPFLPPSMQNVFSQLGIPAGPDDQAPEGGRFAAKEIVVDLVAGSITVEVEP